MQRIMIIGQPGSGKSTLARQLGAVTFLPVIHIDQLIWEPGWVEADPVTKLDRISAAHASDRWIFEGGVSSTWPERLDRADMLIWLDLPVGLRLWRVLRRTARHYGRTRPDLPAGCPERFNRSFLNYIWRTRHSGRDRCAALFRQCPADKDHYHLKTRTEVASFLSSLTDALKVGHLGIPHR